MVDPVVIVVAPIGRGKFSASYCSQVLVESSNIPFCDAARVLTGYPPRVERRPAGGLKPHALQRTAASFRSMVPMVPRGSGCTLESRLRAHTAAKKLRDFDLSAIHRKRLL
jgi:hypothetical protein